MEQRESKKVAKITGYYALDDSDASSKQSMVQDIEVTADSTISYLRSVVDAKLRTLGATEPYEYEMWCRPGTTGVAWPMADDKTLGAIFPQ